MARIHAEMDGDKTKAEVWIAQEKKKEKAARSKDLKLPFFDEVKDKTGSYLARKVYDCRHMG